MKRAFATSKKRSMPRKKAVKSWGKSQGVQTSTFTVPTPRSYPLGRTRKVTFLYHEVFNLDAAAGTIATYVFSANGCYDPNITGIGHQPRGFDQLMALYDHGTVIGCKMDMAISNPNTVSQWVAVTCRDTATVGTPSFNDVMEVPKLAWTYVTPNTGGGVANLSMAVNPSKFLGRSNPLSEDNLRFSKSANPSEGVYFHISTGQPAGGDPAPIYCQVRLEYTAVLSEPSMPGES